MEKENIYTGFATGSAYNGVSNDGSSFHISGTAIPQPQFIFSDDDIKDQTQADIYSIDSIKKLNLEKITKFISDSTSNNILLDFCFDFYPQDQNGAIGTKIECLIRHLSYIIKTHQDYIFTILLRGVYFEEYSKFDRIAKNIDILCKSYIFVPSEHSAYVIPESFKIIDL